MNINAQKNRLRKEAKEKRSSIENKEELSEKIGENLFSLESYKNCKKLFAYFSYPQEVSTQRIIEKALTDGKKVAIPRCENENKMTYYYIESETELEEGNFNGILEPKPNGEKAFPDEETLVIVPALAFGKDGSRLGHGMGFYDRFLARGNFKTVGLCFGKLLFSALPEDEFDRRVSLVITENEIICVEKTAPQK